MNEKKFIEETKKLGITITEDQMKKLNSFYKILIEENKKINLTRITQKEEVYLKHFYDSLTLIKVVDLTKNLTICDVGTGAGFPGIVLKIVFPNLKVTLIDALQKRITYLDKVIDQLELKDIETFHGRSEDYAKEHREKFDIVTARAVANLKILSEIILPMVKVNGLFIAMKANASQEIEDSKEIIKELGAKIESVKEFVLPEENATRSLIKIKKFKKTASKYPRPIDKIKKSL